MAMSDGAVNITLPGVLRGVRGIFAISLYGFPLGIAFGVAATEAGLSPALTTTMSALVFAGASQFAALEFWTAPIVWIPLLLVVFAVNAGHILLGASLYPWMRAAPLWQRHAAAAFITDANWAYAIAAHRNGTRDLGILVGSGAMMWAGWVSGTLVGAAFTDRLIDPAVFALDTLMVTFFATVVVGLAKDETAPWPWLAAAGVALAAYWVLPPGWHILAGGLAGGLVGCVLHGR